MLRSKLVVSNSTQGVSALINRIGTLSLTLVPLLIACSQSPSSGNGGMGGAVGGGNPAGSSGGTTLSSLGGSQTSSSSQGGQTGTNSQVQTGGNSQGQGGASVQGGQSTGVGQGGLSQNGGAYQQGGGSSGASTTGGVSTSGGASTTGGSKSTGGVSTSGGASTTGGSKSTGGVSTSSGASTGGTGAVGGDTSAAVRFIGRMDRSDVAGPKFAWSGSGMIARFSGTSVSVKLNGGQEYTVVLDGTVKNKLVATNGTNSVAQGLTAGSHTIELYRRTEANQGEAQFLGFDFGSGTLLAPPAAATRRLEIVGDSITCGYGDEGADQNCGFSAGTENHYLTYGAIAARDLSAELITIAWSGKGVVCNYGDEADSCTNPLPTYYDRALPDRADSQWDFSSFQPDAVVVNLGTNDVSTTQDPTQTQFENAYKTFLQHIRSKYPNAYLLCTNGSMLSGTELSTVRTYIDNVVKALNADGDSKVGSFELTPQASADGYGCDWHPSLATQQKMAVELEAALKKALGW